MATVHIAARPHGDPRLGRPWLSGRETRDLLAEQAQERGMSLSAMLTELARDVEVRRLRLRGAFLFEVVQ